jgi:hypothetical protein
MRKSLSSVMAEAPHIAPKGTEISMKMGVAQVRESAPVRNAPK